MVIYDDMYNDVRNAKCEARTSTDAWPISVGAGKRAVTIYISLKLINVGRQAT